MRLTKVSAVLLLNLVALGAIPSVAHAASSLTGTVIVKNDHDGNDNNGSTSHGTSSSNSGTSSTGSTPVYDGSIPIIMPPVIIRPDDQNGEDGTKSWTPPTNQSTGVQGLGDPLRNVIPFGHDSNGVRPMVPPAGHTSKPFVVTPIAPSENPTIPNVKPLSGATITNTLTQQQIDPDQNQAISVSRIAFGAESPMQDFINQAMIVLVILGLLSVGLISVILRNSRNAKLASLA